MATTDNFEISRFTFFFEDISINKNSNKDSWHQTEIDYHSDIRGTYAQDTKIEYILPLSQNFMDLWKKGYNKKYICEIKFGAGEDDQCFMYYFKELSSKVLIFENRIRQDINNIDKAIEGINKDEDKKKLYETIIKKKFPKWKGDYCFDGDYFYFINMPIDGFNNNQHTDEENKNIVRNIKKRLTFDKEDVFSRLGFQDKTFPDIKNYDLGVSQIIGDEKQPLVVISPFKFENKLFVLDDKLFVRCYDEKSKNDELKGALSIRAVIVTALYQRAFLEFTSKSLVNTTDEDVKNINSFKIIQKEFAKFTGVFWRSDISNSFYLNKSYRIIGKI